MAIEHVEDGYRRLFRKKLEEGFKCDAKHKYLSEKGVLLYYLIRLRHPLTREKFIRPMSLFSGVWQMKEPVFVGLRPLYNLLDIIGNPTAIIYVTEGEWACDQLNSYFKTNAIYEECIAVTSCHGAEAANNSDWSSISHRTVRIWRDNDSKGLDYANSVTSILEHNNCKISWIDIERLQLSDKDDCVDWIKTNANKNVLELPLIKSNISTTSINGSNLQEWPEPEPIVQELPPVETFTFDLLPNAFRPWVSDVSYRMQCPPDFVATALMVVASSVIGAGCHVRPKQRDDWTVIPNLWGAAIGSPSMLKTPSIAEALKPLQRIEAEAKEKFEEEIMIHNNSMTEHEAEKKALKKNLERSKDEKIKNQLLESVNSEDNNAR